MNPVASPPAVTAPPRKRRWLRRALVILFAFVGLPAGYYFYASWSLERDLADAIAETDRLDPRWRLEDIQADRKTYADDENAALQVIKLNRLIGRSPASHRDYNRVFSDLAAPVQLNSQQIAIIREAFEKYPDALVEARKLKDMKGGRFPITYTADWINSPSSVLDVRVLFIVMAHDAMLRAHDGDLDGSLESCIALTSATQSFGDEPSLYALLVRVIGGNRLLVWAIERCLAQGQFDGAPLGDLQTRLVRERDELHKHFVNGLRGERAGQYRLFLALREGRLQPSDFTVAGKDGPSLWNRIADRFPVLHARHFPQHLRDMNELVAVAQLPFAEQLDRCDAVLHGSDLINENKIKQWGGLPKREMFGNHIAVQASLICAASALACERYRTIRQRWPESLSELVQAKLLDAVPTDPFDGQPLRLARRKDGITVYSVGHDRQDNGGNIDRDHPMDTGADIGFRLWDPEHRRQPPRPTVTLER
jgi:hypothetical protein